MDPIQILIVSGVLTAILVVVLWIRSRKIQALSNQQEDLIRSYAAENGYTFHSDPSHSIEWTIETPEWAISFDSDRNADESSSPRIQLSSKIPFNSKTEFISVCNHARKSLGNGMMRSMTTTLTPNQKFTTPHSGEIPFTKIYDMIDRNTSAPLGKNEKPYVAVFANSSDSLNQIMNSAIPNISDRLNADEKRVELTGSPHIVKINPHLEVTCHCQFPTLDKVKALKEMFDAVKALR